MRRGVIYFFLVVAAIAALPWMISCADLREESRPTAVNQVGASISWIYDPPTSTCAFGCSIQFQGNTDNTGRFFFWNFGNGQGDSGTNRSPRVTYFCRGDMNSNSGDICVRTVTLRVCPANNTNSPKCGEDQTTIVLPALVADN